MPQNKLKIFIKRQGIRKAWRFLLLARKTENRLLILSILPAILALYARDIDKNFTRQL